MNKIKDPLELQIAQALTNAQIKFIHESENNGSRLDFYLPDFDLYLEVKSGFTQRAHFQLESKINVILIQGMKSTAFLCELLTRHNQGRFEK